LRLDIIRAKSKREIKERLFLSLENHKDILPKSNTDAILLKPNLNANMNALTGNTTDLRLMAFVVEYLKDKGYQQITIGEGTNSGYYRNNISVISRLRVDQLAKYYGIKIIDLNYSEPYAIEFDNHVTAYVAKECVEAELFINLPKLKTHFEAGMSVCLKNLMGCLIGQENKKKTHDNLPENILRINQVIKPHLHIVDALIAMEGLGPTRGTPVRMDTIFVGTDPYLTDLACARLADFDYLRVRTLNLAEQKGLLTPRHHEKAATLGLEKIKKTFAPPIAGPLATFIHSPKRQKFFLKIRAMRFFSYLASTSWFGKLLFLTGLRQDVFLNEEMNCEGLHYDKAACRQCGICRDVCPLDSELPEHLDELYEKCIHCLYCYSACPQQAIQFKGKLGFFSEQLKQYNDIIRKLYK